MEILQVLWDSGEATVRDVLVALSKIRETGYTTPLKILQKMTGKGLVTRDTSQKTHICRPNVSREQVIEQSIDAIVDCHFKGSHTKFLEHVVKSKSVTQKEAETILKMIGQPTRRATKRVSSKGK